MTISRTFDLLDRYRDLHPRPDAFAAKVDGSWKTTSSEEYISKAHLVAYGLLGLGMKQGDKVVTVTPNRPEWNIVDMGMAMTGVVHVPVFTSLGEQEYSYVLNHSDARMVIVADTCLYEKIRPAADRTPGVEWIFTFDPVEGAPNWSEILDTGRRNEERYGETLENIKRSISEEDCATLIYTSGTTGTCKGVMLSHRNLVRNFLAAAEVFRLTPEDRYLSILPLCHVGGRMGNYQTQYSGTAIYYAESMGAIAANMKEVMPDGFDTVPRILEKVFDNVIARGRTLSGMKKRIFFGAVNLGLKYRLPDESSWLYRKRLKLADRLIFIKWREALGGRVRMAGCGGASLQARLERIFWAAGLKVINMYGLTETSPVITINRQEKPGLRLGSVGALIEGVEVKIAGDGEILCRGHNVMSGYYKDPGMTAAAIDEEGWFHTGDIGHMEDGKFLFVTDRKKEIFKLSSGKFVAPQVIENIFKESLFIENLMVVGEHEKFASALISPSFSYLRDWCRDRQLEAGRNEELIIHPEVVKAVGLEVAGFNRRLNDPEKVLRFRLVADEWSPATGELSPTLKLRRKVISERYRSLLDEIYPKQKV